MARGAQKAETYKSYFLPMGVRSKGMDGRREEEVGVNVAGEGAGLGQAPPHPLPLTRCQERLIRQP